MACQSFEDLDVWQRACRLAVGVAEALAKSQHGALRDLMMRASLSIPSNIAEGAERGTSREFIRFLHIAKGSAAELRTQLYIASKLQALDKSSVTQFITEAKAISQMLHGLIKSQSPNT